MSRHECQSGRDESPGAGAEHERRSEAARFADRFMDPLYDAAVECTEEAILNALCAAETMTGHLGTVHAVPLDRLVTR